MCSCIRFGAELLMGFTSDKKCWTKELQSQKLGGMKYKDTGTILGILGGKVNYRKKLTTIYLYSSM